MLKKIFFKKSLVVKLLSLTKYLILLSLVLFLFALITIIFSSNVKAASIDTITKQWKDEPNSTVYPKAINTQDGTQNVFPDNTDISNFPALEACYNLNSGNKDDWYLPAIDELNTLYNSKKYFNTDSNGLINQKYWSSTNFKSLNMTNGSISSSEIKSSLYNIRCIRKANCTPNADPCTNNTKCGWQPNNCGSGANCSCLSNPTNKICDTSNYTCVECTSNSNCSGNKPICNTTTKTCQACTTDTECKNISGLNSKPDAVCSNGTCYDSVCANKLAGEDPIVANACTGTCKTGKCDGSGKCQYLNAGDSCAECGVCTVSGSSMNCQATAVTKSSDCGGLTSPCRVCSGSGIGLCIGQVAETAPTKIGATCQTIDCTNTVKGWSNNGDGKECEKFTANTSKNGACKANSGICYGISGLTSAAPAEYNNVCSGSAVINQCIDAECRFSCLLGDLVSGQDINRSCFSNGLSNVGGVANCNAPKKCIAGGDCIECSSNDDCPGACKICSNGSCVNATAGTNPKGKCDLGSVCYQGSCCDTGCGVGPGRLCPGQTSTSCGGVVCNTPCTNCCIPNGYYGGNDSWKNNRCGTKDVGILISDTQGVGSGWCVGDAAYTPYGCGFNYGTYCKNCRFVSSSLNGGTKGCNGGNFNPTYTNTYRCNEGTCRL